MKCKTLKLNVQKRVVVNFVGHWSGLVGKNSQRHFEPKSELKWHVSLKPSILFWNSAKTNKTDYGEFRAGIMKSNDIQWPINKVFESIEKLNQPIRPSSCAKKALESLRTKNKFSYSVWMPSLRRQGSLSNVAIFNDYLPVLNSNFCTLNHSPTPLHKHPLSGWKERRN